MSLFLSIEGLICFTDYFSTHGGVGPLWGCREVPLTGAPEVPGAPDVVEAPPGGLFKKACMPPKLTVDLNSQFTSHKNISTNYKIIIYYFSNLNAQNVCWSLKTIFYYSVILLRFTSLTFSFTFLML